MRDSNLQRNRQEQEIRQYYRVLFRAWGKQHWWPARTRFEVVVGAYLTQNTAWTNVERALANLRAARALSVEGIRRTPLPALESLIRPSGYFRQKAKRLKRFVAFLDNEYGGSLTSLFSQPTSELRETLLRLNGVGPETADSILLYAGNHPVFVVDAYTRRILSRHAILAEDAAYDDIRTLFERALTPITQQATDDALDTSASVNSAIRSAGHLPSAMSIASRSPQAQTYNEMHGLIVGVGKHYCKKTTPLCEKCPLQPFLPRGR
jgi:endonuclease-3 related protein